MLIKSQDGKVIVNTNTLVSLNVYNCKIYCETTYSDENYGFIMGTYDSDDEARAALDNLYDAIDEPKYDMGNEKDLPENNNICAEHTKRKISYW